MSEKIETDRASSDANIIRRSCFLLFDEGWTQPTPEELRKLIRRLDMSGSQVANYVGMGSARAVRKWLAPTGEPNARNIPYSAWRLLVELDLNLNRVPRLVLGSLPELKKVLEQSLELTTWIDSKIDGIRTPDTLNNSAALMLFQQSLDICDSIRILLTRGMPGTCYALMRPVFEAYARGYWLIHIATDNQAGKFAEGKGPRLEEIVKKIANSGLDGSVSIKGFWEKNKITFHDLAHGGSEHLNRRRIGSSITPNYQEAEQASVMVFATEIAVRIGVEMFDLAKDERAIVEIAQKYSEFGAVMDYVHQWNQQENI